MSAVRARRSDEKGFALVLVALVLLVLMLFAAFAVDLGGLYNARRQDQNAADAATLAGAQDLGDPALIFSQVDQRASATLDISTGTIDWTDCTLADPDFVDTPIVVASVTYNCITENDSSTQLQVKLPTRQYGSLFGGVAGIDSFDHSAFAIAGVAEAGFGGVLPFGLPASAGGENVACMKDGPHADPPCDGPDSGNFGYLDFTQYGNTEKGTTESCTGNTSGRLSNNIASGIDHDLGTYTGTRRIDRDECGNLERRATSMYAETGNKNAAFGAGMYSGGPFADGENARLQRTDPSLFADGGSSSESVAGHTLDDNALWEFIDPEDSDGDGDVSVPASCNKAIFDNAEGGSFSLLPDGSDGNLPADVQSLVSATYSSDPYAAFRLLIDRCLTHYRGLDWDGRGADDDNGPISGEPDPDQGCVGTCDDAVFARNDTHDDFPDLYDIQYTSRFGYVPQLTTSFGTPVANPNVYDISIFRAVFLQRLVGGCNSSGTGCSLDFEPAAGRSARASSEPGGGSAEAVTAWLFSGTILPNGLAGENAPFDLGRNRFTQLIR